MASRSRPSNDRRVASTRPGSCYKFTYLEDWAGFNVPPAVVGDFFRVFLQMAVVLTFAGALPVVMHIGAALFTQFGRPDASIIESYLWNLPAAALFSWFVFLEMRLLLLDEPLEGLAPLIVREIFRIIATLRQTGVSILLIEQNARAALEVADHGYVLETGAFSVQGPADQLAVDPRVIETYLGAARPAA